MTTRTPAQAVSGDLGRPARRARACAILTEARKAAGLTMLALSADAGCQQKVVQRMEDESDTGHPVHADVWLAPLIVKEAARAMCREAGMIAIEIPIAAADSEALRQLAAIQRETSDVVTTALEAFADGTVTKSERNAMRAEIAQAIEALVKLDAALAVVGDEAIASVRSIGVKR